MHEREQGAAGRVVHALFSHPGVTRAEVATLAGLSRGTAAQVLDELAHLGALEQRRTLVPALARTGRPPLRVSIASQAILALGLDVTGRETLAVVADLSGRVVAEARSGGDTFALVDRVIADAGRGHLIGIGIAVPGDPDPETHLPAWPRLAGELAAHTGLEVLAEPAASAAVLGEQLFGAGRGVNDLAFVRVAEDVGLGLVLDGRVHRGANAMAGELGHSRVDGHDAPCRCGGRGCLETLVAAALADGRRSPAALAEIGTALGRSIAVAVNLFNPSLLLIGGELATGGDALIRALSAALDERASHATAVELRHGALGDRAEPLGAAGLHLRRAPHALTARLAASGSASPSGSGR